MPRHFIQSHIFTDAHCKVATFTMPLAQTNLTDKGTHMIFAPSLVNNTNLYLFYYEKQKTKTQIINYTKIQITEASLNYFAV